LELPPRTFRIVQRRYKGDSYALIAEELKVTPQAVEIQLRRALEAHPHLKQLLPEKAKRQAARKRRQRSIARENGKRALRRKA
jgi:DNA-directed RNA polymerase specialized sigma24 family protein